MFPKEIDFPSYFELFMMLSLSICVFDLWFYLFHRFLHEHRNLYIKFHKPHHKYTGKIKYVSIKGIFFDVSNKTFTFE